MSLKSKSIRLILTVAQYNALREESKRTGVPMNEIIRRALAARTTKKAAQ